MSLLTSALNFVPMFALSWLFLFEASRRRTPTAALFAGYFQIVLVLTALVVITTFRFIPGDPGWLSACLIGVAAIAAIEVGRIAKNPASSAPGELRENVAHLENTGGAWFTPRFHSAKEIAAPIETVFRYLADPALWNEWSIIPMKVTRTSDGDWGQGTTYRQTFRAQGRQYSQTAEILRFEPPFLIDERCATNEVWAANATTRLSRTPSGNTRVELSCAQTALTPKRRVLLRLFWPFFLLSSVWMLDRNLKKLRRVIENGDSALQAQRVRAARIGWVATGVAILATLHLPWTLPVVLDYGYYDSHPFVDLPPVEIMLLLVGPVILLSAIPGFVALRFGRRAYVSGDEPSAFTAIIGAVSLAFCGLLLSVGLYDAATYEPRTYEPDIEAICAGTYPGDCVSDVRPTS